MKTIRLEGRLGAKFGREYRFAVDSPAEAVRALSTQLEGFRKHIVDSTETGVEYAFFVGKENIDPKGLHKKVSEDVITITPVPAGAKRGGLFQTILGAAMIASVFAFPATAGAELFMIGSAEFTLGQALFTVGASLLMGGVSQMISPQPKMDLSSTSEEGPNRSFNGVVNTMAQGDCVPVALGKVLIGSATISGSVFTQEGKELVQGTDAEGRPGWVFAQPT